MNRLKVFKALSNDKRLKIIDLIDHNNLCACKILEKIELSQSTVSHHMKILEDADLVNTKKDGKWRYYSINQQTFNELKAFFSKLENNSSDLKKIDEL